MRNRDIGSRGLPPRPPSNTRAIVAMVLGIATLLFMWLKFISFFLSPVLIIIAIVGILLSVANRKDNLLNRHPMGVPTAALIINVVSLTLNVLFLTICVACVACIVGL